MREIKFRAFFEPLLFKSDPKQDGVWQEITVDMKYDQSGWVQKTDWMQYIGLKDKNGIEIYEGDIIKITGATINEYSWEGEVYFDCGTFCLKANQQPEHKKYVEKIRIWNDGSHNHYSLEIIESYEMEVIGNSYENPELVQVAYGGGCKK